MNKFVLVINSRDYYQRFTNLNDQSYIMNNTNIPPGNYKCRWSFRNGSEGTGNVGIYPTIYLRTASAQQAYIVGSSGNNQISYCLGCPLQFTTTAGTSYHRCGPYDNPAFYINYRPGYEIRITLRADTTQNLFGGTSDYILMIEMERIEEDED